MRTLLKKEFTFTAFSLTYIFLIASGIAFLPGYPILCAPFFVCLGLFYTFQMAREGNDALYTSLLPVRKADVVKARYIFCVAIEMIAFLIIAVITVIRMVCLANAKPYIENPLMNANLMYLGFVLIMYAAFNGLFCKDFWKDAYSLGIPLLKCGIAMLIIVFVGEALHHIPGMQDLNSSTGHMPIQIGILIGGCLLYIATTVLACRKSMISYEKLDLHM